MLAIVAAGKRRANENAIRPGFCARSSAAPATSGWRGRARPRDGGDYRALSTRKPNGISVGQRLSASWRHRLLRAPPGGRLGGEASLIAPVPQPVPPPPPLAPPDPLPS